MLESAYTDNDEADIHNKYMDTIRVEIMRIDTIRIE